MFDSPMASNMLSKKPLAAGAPMQTRQHPDKQRKSNSHQLFLKNAFTLTALSKSF